ncbi:MAG: Bax inhibitor-1/YccA family protein [Spirochaetia bacterium]|nr:Bax inhibitor-1/YccA family protein [Spirochaetia bacterium]
MNNSVIVRTTEDERKKFMSGVYTWMTLALALSGLTAFGVASSPAILQLIFGNELVFFGLIIAELVLVMFFSFRVHKMSVTAASLVYIVYSILNGITLASIFIVYTKTSIFSVFLISAGMFAAMSIYGRVTKQDLRSAGRYLTMALFGVIIASVVNIFLKSSGLDWLLSLVTVGIFVGLTAYDTQKAYAIAERADGSDMFAKASVVMALELYLDFINIFLSLLRLFGKKN